MHLDLWNQGHDSLQTYRLMLVLLNLLRKISHLCHMYLLLLSVEAENWSLA